MRGLHKSKRVSWASDVNLCQVRLFLSEESPSQVGLGAQDHLQAKSSLVTHTNGVGADDILPPGFEGAHTPNQLQIDLSEIPIIPWRCLPKFCLDSTWQVVAGDESKEAEIQNQREMRVLEAVYPRPSAIPPNPSVSADAEGSHYNDQPISLIPITPIEDEEAGDAQSGQMAPLNAGMSSQPPHSVPGIPPPPPVSIPSVSHPPVNGNPASGTVLSVDPIVVAAASAALTEMSRRNGNGSLIDHDLLLTILSNPTLIEKLVTDHGSASNTQNIPQPTFPLVPPSSDHPPPSVPLSHPSVPLSHPSPLRVNMMETSSPLMVASSSGAFYPQPNAVGVGHHPNAWGKPPPGVVPTSSPPTLSYGASQAKDVNYYKNLIHQHGGERPDFPQQFGNRYSHQPGMNQESVNNNPKPRDSKPKIMRPCIYFNSARGCRHGAKCAYQHDPSSQQRGNNMPELQNAKRMKMDREISS